MWKLSLNLSKYDFSIELNKVTSVGGGEISMDFMKDAKRLPVLDWNLTFFGAHEQQVGSDWIVPMEKHYAFECIYVLAGQEFIKIYGNVYTLKAGDFFLVPPEFLHQVWAGERLKYFCFHFDIDDPALKVQLIKGLNYDYEKDSDLSKQLKPHFDKLDSLVADESFDFDTKMVIQIELSKILRIFFQATKRSQHSNATTSTEYARLMADYLKEQLTNQVLNYVKNGYIPDDRMVEVSSAIAKIGFSNGYGFRIFKETYGISPRDYLSKLKINEAKKLLGKPQYSINDIGSALGYRNLANFSRQFKRWTDISPSQFRKQGRENSR